jgi:hypothetical protein
LPENGLCWEKAFTRRLHGFEISSQQHTIEVAKDSKLVMTNGTKPGG